jgi:predicted Fe-Mo cluster-binding NifX family protein
MRIAIPVTAGSLAAHFGHCEEFALLDVDVDTRAIVARDAAAAPPHQPGMLPGWLAGYGAEIVIAGGMGVRAQQLFQQHDIRVLVGAPSRSPEEIVQAYLDGSLEVGTNLCDH